jgi:argininosuccinate lyase
MAQLWQGRFSKAVDSRVNDFNSSIRFDSRMFRQDINGSMAHATMLGEQGIISPEDQEAILDGLQGILTDLQEGELSIDPEAEDIHTFIEQTLTARIGDAGKRLHTGRSRNDQVALDIRLTLRDESEKILGQILDLAQSLCRQAEANLESVMPGYTHLQRAQPITFGHQLMAYVWMLLRDAGRIQDALKRMMAYCPLGSGALAGTTYPLDRQLTASLLGFEEPCPNSLDGVSDRDFCIELCAAFATCMMHLSRLSEEIILWCSWEFRFVELDDAFTTGSSIMPQKKNPDVTELIRGKTGRVYGDLTTLLTMMKGISLAYDKDMQEDKEAMWDAIDTLSLCLTTLTPLIDTMKALPQNMRAAAAGGFINATDCADYLTKKGMPFRDAYKLTGSLVAYCIDHHTTLEALPLETYRQHSPLFEEDVYQAIDLLNCCEGRTSYGGPSKAGVQGQLQKARQEIEAIRNGLEGEADIPPQNETEEEDHP